MYNLCFIRRTKQPKYRNMHCCQRNRVTVAWWGVGIQIWGRMGAGKPLCRIQRSKENEIILTAKTDVYNSKRSINNNITHPSILSSSINGRKSKCMFVNVHVSDCFVFFVVSLCPTFIFLTFTRPMLFQSIKNSDWNISMCNLYGHQVSIKIQYLLEFLNIGLAVFFLNVCTSSRFIKEICICVIVLDVFPVHSYIQNISLHFQL